MENNGIKLVEMTPEQAAEFEAFKMDKELKEKTKQQLNEREKYKIMIDDYISGVFPNLQTCSKTIANVKREVIDTFKAAIELKTELFNVKDEQRSHTFTHRNGTMRIMVGNYTADGYADTVNEGVAIVKEIVSSLAKDEQSQALTTAILKLLSKDQKGSLKPSRVLQLKQMAIQLHNDRLSEAVTIIEEAYQPTISKTFIRAEMKNADGAWVNVPLGITEA